MIYVGIVSRDIGADKAAGLRDFFDEIKTETVLWKAFKNESKSVDGTCGYFRPQRTEGDVFVVNEFAFSIAPFWN